MNFGKGARTIGIGIIAGIFSLLETQEILDFIPDDFENSALPIIISLLMIIMRFLTNTPVGKKQ